MYKPYPIYNMKYGKHTATEPWLAPQDAFETFRNGHLRNGVLEKRRGRTLLGQIVHVDTTTKAPTLKTNPVMGIFNYEDGSTESLIALDKLRLNKYITTASTNKSITKFEDGGGGTSVKATSTAHGFVTYDVVTISGTTNYNGTFAVTKLTDDTFKFTATWVSLADETGTADQEVFLDVTTKKLRFQHGGVQVGSVIVGNTIDGAGGGQAVVRGITIDTGTWAGNDACGTFHLSDADNPSGQTGTFVDTENITVSGVIVGVVDGGDSTDDEFTGDNTNFFTIANWNNVSYLTNNNDILQKYDGTYLTRFHIDLDVEGGPDNDVTRCKFIVVYKSRLVIFDTTETGDGTKRQRARWCDVNDPDTWPNASYSDADTNEALLAVHYFGDDLIVWFERSVWAFEYTSDPNNPFRWSRIDDSENIAAAHSLIRVDNELIGLGKTRVVATDGRDAYPVDRRIQDFVLDWVTGSAAYGYGVVQDERRRALLTYTSLNASAHADGNKYPDSVLVLNTQDKSWSTYSGDIHCFGRTELESDMTWDRDEAWEDIDWSWDEQSIQGGFPNTLMGDHGGKIFRLNSGGSDDGSDIEFNATGGRWNPYVREGRKARLGWIDFLVDIDASVSFDVEHYLDTESSSFKTNTITCTAVNGSADKAWHRVYVNALATCHRINITNSDSANRPRIHAIVPYMEPGGVLV
jgi:hypothetical protein